MRKVCLLNTGGTFCQCKNDNGVLDMPKTAKQQNDIQNRSLSVVNGYFPHLDVSMLWINDDEFFVSWEKQGLAARLFDSSAMNPKHWNVLANVIAYLSRQYDSIVVIHGTDSLAYTAAALSFLIIDRGFPIVVTGSQFPLLSTNSDAARNLVESVAVANYNTSAGYLNGVHVCFFGKIMRGVHVVKVSSIEEDAFSAPRFDEVGTTNYSTVNINPQYIGSLAIKAHSLSLAMMKSKRRVNLACTETGAVMIIKVYPGIDVSYLSVLRSSFPSLRCVLFVGLGSGNGPDALKAPINCLLDNFVFVAVASDCLDGRASERYATSIVAMDNSIQRRDGTFNIGNSRIVAVENMNTEAAYAKILVILGNPKLVNNTDGVLLFKTRMTGNWAEEQSFDL